MDAVTERELEQQRKFEEFLKLVRGILRRRMLPFAGVFALLFAAVFALLVHRAAKAPDMWQASTTVVFYPKSSSKIKAMDGDQVMQIFARRLMYSKLAETLRLDTAERLRLRRDLQMTQERGRKMVYNIVAKARTEQDAMRKANVFAQLCVKEYVAYRTEDLQRWMDSIRVRKGEISNEMRRVDEAETALNREAGAISPLAESERLNNLVSENKAALSAIQIRLINAETKRKRLEGEVGALNPAAVRHAPQLRKMQADIEKLKTEITGLEELYTVHNPKLQVVMGRLEQTQRQWREFLAEHGISEDDLPGLEDLAKSEKQLEETESAIEALKESKTALEAEVAANSAAAKKILDFIPQFDAIKSRRATLRESLQTIEDTLSDVRYLQASIRSDISQVEPAQYGICNPPLSKKRLLLAFALSGALAAMLLAAAVLAELVWGRIAGAKEVAICRDVVLLGDMPAAGDVDGRKAEFDALFYHFQEVRGDLSPLYLGVLPGAVGANDFLHRLELSMAMSGKRMMLLEVEGAKEAKLPDGGEAMAIAVCAGGRGMVPVANVHSLSPLEMRLLRSDVDALKSRFDLIVLMRRVRESSRGVMIEQMLKYCEVAMVLIGAGRTPRAMLRHAVEKTRASGKTLIAAVTGRSERRRRP